MAAVGGRQPQTHIEGESGKHWHTVGRMGCGWWGVCVAACSAVSASVGPRGAVFLELAARRVAFRVECAGGGGGGGGVGAWVGGAGAGVSAEAADGTVRAPHIAHGGRTPPGGGAFVSSVLGSHGPREGAALGSHGAG